MTYEQKFCHKVDSKESWHPVMLISQSNSHPSSGLDNRLHLVPPEREGRGSHHLAQQRRRVLVEASAVRHGRLQAQRLRTF